MLKDRGPRMLEADPKITSVVDIFVKDLGIVLQAGDSIKAALPICGLGQTAFPGRLRSRQRKHRRQPGYPRVSRAEWPDSVGVIWEENAMSAVNRHFADIDEVSMRTNISRCPQHW
jgi:hypothetical protein